MGFRTVQEAVDYCRRFLRDTPELNELLEGYETSDEDLARYVQDCVDEFNSTPPLNIQANLENFPSNTALRDYVVFRVLSSAAIWYERNRLNYTDARGVSTVLKDKGGSFANLAQQYKALWSEWLYRYKVTKNVDSSYGSVYQWP